MKKVRIPEFCSEIQAELRSLEKIVAGIEAVRKEMPCSSALSNIYTESLALKLHNFYTGSERIFRIIAEEINGKLPRSEDWHRRLLRVMSLEVVNVRPPVISEGTARGLDEFLAFRHVVRNIYGFELQLERLIPLAERADIVFRNLKDDIGQFLEFLRKMAD